MRPVAEAETERHIERGVESLVEEFRDVYRRETIEHAVKDALDSLSDAKFEDFVPVLAHREARERLKDLAAKS